MSKLLAFENPNFKWFFGMTFFTTLGIFMHDALVGYAIYHLTKDPMALGLMGLVESIPYILMSLFGGHVADKHDRKKTIALAFVIIAACVLWVGWALSSQLLIAEKLMLIYAALIISGFARGFYAPAKFSYQTSLTPRAHYGSAATWGSIAWQIGMIGGPALFGWLFGRLHLNYMEILWGVCGLIGLAFLTLIPLPNVPSQAEKLPENMFHSIREGFQFVKKEKILLYAISLDLFSVLFGGIVALLPVFAEEILKVDAAGYGLLAAASSTGAVLTMLLLTHYSPLHHAWRNLLLSITGFGIATLIFALSTHFWLSLAMLFLVGASDSISVVIRQAILQYLPPEHLRGRVAAVNGIFISASNEIGRFESGVAAKLFGLVPSVLFGAGVTLSLVAFVALKSKALFAIDIHQHQPATANEPQS